LSICSALSVGIFIVPPCGDPIIPTWQFYGLTTRPTWCCRLDTMVSSAHYRHMPGYLRATRTCCEWQNDHYV